ncbi:MAG: carbohydrate ABC transporter permease [Chloroflexota bacterium]|nr:carbohydrate ABC transporter permease [Chloroflexota bacterium]
MNMTQTWARPRRRPFRWSAFLSRAAIYGVLIAGAVVVMLPFAWTLSTSLKAPSDIFVFPPRWIPDPIMWSNYPEALTSYPFGRWLQNTLFVVVFSTIATLISCSMVAYSFARLRWPGRDILFLVLLSTMMLPEQVSLIPTFIGFRYLGWVNTFLPLIIPPLFARNAFYVFLLRQFFMTIPLDLDDAARIDGAGYFAIYSRILLPMSKPALAIAGIMFFQFKWKEFFAPLIYLHDSEKYTIALGLRAFQSPTWGTDWHLMMAANIVFMLPLIVIFYFAQRYFIQGIVFTGVKG